MGILYNANLTPAMNDVSVTSGNADGWIYAAALSREMTAAALGHEKSSRRSADEGRAPKSSGKRSKKQKR